MRVPVCLQTATPSRHIARVAGSITGMTNGVGAHPARRIWPLHLAWAAPATMAFVVYAVWSVTRHRRFGSGAWDLGNHSQSVWLLAHLKGFTSSVLGDVNFMGDHFMPSIVLLAPLAWTGSSEVLLYLQALLIVAAAWPLALLCRRRGITPPITFGIVVAYLFGVGTQSTANFDFHLVAALPLTLLLALWAFEEDRRPLAYTALIVAAGCRESAILYAGAVGGWLLITRPGRRLEGFWIATAFLVWFFAVVSWIQPRLLSGAPAWMLPVARYSAFGSTFGEAALWVLGHPGQSALLLVSPREKLATLGLTFGGFGFLPFLAPDAVLLAVPNFMERFLSAKREAWGIGYHYSLVPTALSAFAAAVAVARIRAFVLARPRRVSPRAFDAAVCAFLIASTVGASAIAMPVGVELVSLEKPYFASLEQTEVNRRAIARIPGDAPVIAQNHFLPHLAMRESIWLPEERFLSRADYLVLDPTQSAWPRDGAHVARLIQVLLKDPTVHVIFSEKATVVFSRRGEPPVPVARGLLRELARYGT